MEKVIIVRYSEIHLKGKNRGYFDRVLILNMEKSLKGLKHEIKGVAEDISLILLKRVKRMRLLTDLKKFSVFIL